MLKHIVLVLSVLLTSSVASAQEAHVVTFETEITCLQWPTGLTTCWSPGDSSVIACTKSDGCIVVENVIDWSMQENNQ